MALTIACVTLVYVRLSSVGDVWIAALFTALYTGGPVVFLAVRLLTYLHGGGGESAPVPFWPHDRSTATTWGLTLVILNMGFVALFALLTADDLWLGGLIARLLSAVQT